ncbi:MAG: outer membrane beta-barrel protein [Candidatus Eisenbacteria bacterium]|uniref:Outer membrane beta-barrel protein n=1 Tax=Eiseniibacteriota bacterium TaxID=2212470 RepID=A0A933W2S8_UNCEI|nr:outer membrane beta-barrel protein [Candidatus Eisenbacteria bacterium]
MKRVRVLVLTFVMLAGFALSASAASIVLPRAGQVGVGVAGQWGALTKGGKLGAEFGNGPGLSVRLRYRMRYERGIGLSFDTQSLDSRSPSRKETAFLGFENDLDPTLVRDRLVMNSAGFDLYQYFGTRKKTVKQLNAGLGITQVSARLSNGEVQYPLGGDGFYLSAGAGLEKFVYRSWAVTLDGRYQAIFHDAKVNQGAQVSLGMIFYAAY